jgi:DNA-binding beta-propeller fold protein YncE
LSEATTQAVSNVKSREVTLNGAVNPSGLATTYRFEYGSTTSYGTSIPVLEETAGSGVEPIIKSQTIKALQPEQVYHYRIVATNAEGATYGQDVRFITTAVPTFNLAIGSSGSGSGQLNRPTGVAVDSTGNLWVADTENNRIEKFNAEGKYIGQFGTKGSGNGQFNKPQDLAFSGSNLWVTDSGNHRLQKFNAEGKYLEQLGSEGTGPGQFIEPYGVTIAEGHIWVSDAGDDRLVEFNSMGKYTREVHGAGYGGSLTGEVNNPTGIASGPDGQIWVADTGNNRVEQFGPEGEYLSTIGKPMDIVQFTAPYGIAVRPSGNLVISEQGADQVQVVLPTGEFLTQYGTNGSGPGQMSDPTGIDLGECGVEYLSDTGNARVEQWDRPTGPEAMTKEASTMISHQAVLRGAVNPCGLATTYRFEYGQTTAYGKSIPIPDESAGSGSQSLTMSKTVTGLMPLTYHFRVVATNSEGSSYGKDETFKVH